MVSKETQFLGACESIGGVSFYQIPPQTYLTPILRPYKAHTYPPTPLPHRTTSYTP